MLSVVAVSPAMVVRSVSSGCSDVQLDVVVGGGVLGEDLAGGAAGWDADGAGGDRLELDLAGGDAAGPGVVGDGEVVVGAVVDAVGGDVVLDPVGGVVAVLDVDLVAGEDAGQADRHVEAVDGGLA